MCKWLKCFGIATLWIIGGTGLGVGIAVGTSLISPTISVVVIVLAMIGILTALIHWEPKGEEDG